MLLFMCFDAPCPGSCPLPGRPCPPPWGGARMILWGLDHHCSTGIHSTACRSDAAAYAPRIGEPCEGPRSRTLEVQKFTLETLPNNSSPRTAPPRPNRTNPSPWLGALGSFWGSGSQAITKAMTTNWGWHELKTEWSCVCNSLISEQLSGAHKKSCWYGSISRLTFTAMLTWHTILAHRGTHTCATCCRLLSSSRGCFAAGTPFPLHTNKQTQNENNGEQMPNVTDLRAIHVLTDKAMWSEAKLDASWPFGKYNTEIQDTRQSLDTRTEITIWCQADIGSSNPDNACTL